MSNEQSSDEEWQWYEVEVQFPYTVHGVDSVQDAISVTICAAGRDLEGVNNTRRLDLDPAVRECPNPDCDHTEYDVQLVNDKATTCVIAEAEVRAKSVDHSEQVTIMSLGQQLEGIPLEVLDASGPIDEE